MIAVTRTDKPRVLENNEATWLSELLDAKRQLEQATTDTEKAQAKREFDAKQGRYAHRDIRAALEAMFGANGLVKCAFCESHISHVGDEHIEHFRPKTTFPEETFAWDNLLIACLVCNRDYKKTQFPRAGDGSPLLIDPTRDVPEQHLEFVWDEMAQLATVVGKDDKGQTTEALLGLNRYALRQHRSIEVGRLAALVRFAQEGDDMAQQLMAQATQPESEYVAFARILIQQC